MLIVNPGSGPVAEASESWTNTYERALREATEWLRRIHEHGITEVELLTPATKTPEEGLWTFRFRHKVTGVGVNLDTPGIDDLDAYRRQRVFDPHIYWSGSSCAEPKLEDWGAPGWASLRTFRRADA